MGAPKVKFYQLPIGYTQDSDNDIQQQSGDELIPLVDKPTLLTDALALTGVAPDTNANLIPISLGGGRAVYPLGPAGATLQTPTGITMAQAAHVQSGNLGLRVLDALNAVISPTGYVVTTTGIQFIMPGPTGAQLSCYQVANTPTTTWAFLNDKIYDGPNPSFNKVIIRVDGGPEQLATPLGTTYDHIVTASASGVVASYWYKNSLSKYFCGDHENWVGGHYNMWPDVFVGVKNYPGDASEVNGINFEPGNVPDYQEPGTYQLNYRQGLVTFPTAVNSVASPVKANYAYLAGVQNVTNQLLDVVTGTGNRQYHAVSEQIFANLHGKRMVQRNDEFIPTNVYVNGVLTPTPKTVVPYDTLTVVTH